MPKGKPIDPTIKAEITAKIRNEGMSVSEASAPIAFQAKVSTTGYEMVLSTVTRI